jgi:hypothetical protein
MGGPSTGGHTRSDRHVNAFIIGFREEEFHFTAAEIL